MTVMAEWDSLTAAAGLDARVVEMPIMDGALNLGRITLPGTHAEATKNCVSCLK